jgi:hypothetical protein
VSTTDIEACSSSHKLSQLHLFSCPFLHFLLRTQVARAYPDESGENPERSTTPRRSWEGRPPPHPQAGGGGKEDHLRVLPRRGALREGDAPQPHRRGESHAHTRGGSLAAQLDAALCRSLLLATM